MVWFPGFAARSVWSAATVCHCHCGGRSCTSRVPQGQDKPSLCLEAQSSHLGPDRWETLHNQQTQVCDNYGLPTQISRRALLPNMSAEKHYGRSAVNTGPLWGVDRVSRVLASLSSVACGVGLGPMSSVSFIIWQTSSEKCLEPPGAFFETT